MAPAIPCAGRDSHAQGWRPLPTVASRGQACMSGELVTAPAVEQPLAVEWPRFWAARVSPALDEISLKFAIYSRSTKGTVADVGCGEGIASVAALLRGAHVHAIDPDPEALKR